MDPEVFRGTPAWEAVKAVMRDDTIRLHDEVRQNSDLIDYPNPYYGRTLLSTAIYHNKIKSVKALLNMGFDPNYKNDSLNIAGDTPLIDAVEFKRTKIEIIKLLLDYGADPNFITTGGYEYINRFVPIHQAAITYAATKDIEKVKLLLQYGADPNVKEGMSPLEKALVTDNINIAILLLKSGSNMDIDYILSGSDVFDGYEEKIDISQILRLLIYDLDSKEYEDKMKLVEYLDSIGIDYRNSPIPPKIIKSIQTDYPDDWQEYIKVY